MLKELTPVPLGSANESRRSVHQIPRPIRQATK